MKFKLYKDVKGEWRWRLVARNGLIMAVSSEGYKDKAGARGAIGTIKDQLANFEIPVEEE